MLKRFFLNRPFWSYYMLAVAFPAFLFLLYLPAIQIVGQSMNGPEYSTMGVFMQLKGGLIERYPALFHHSDSWVLYVCSYFLFPMGWPMFFMPAAPTTAALIVTAVARGKTAVKALLGLYRPIQGALTGREGLRIYAVLIAGIAFMTMTACLMEYFFGDPERAIGYLPHLGVIQWDIFLMTWFMGLLFNQGGALEELGWRGYALPMLIRKLGSPLNATLLLGVCWALWHFPREIWPLLQGAQSISELLASQVWFILMCCGMSIVATYFVNITGGSVLPAIIIHGAFNQIGGMFTAEHVGMRTELAGDGAYMWMAAAVVILLLAGRDLGWKRRLQLLQDKDPADNWVDQPPRI